MTTLHIQLLGQFHLMAGGQQVTTVNQVRQQTLLAYLLLHRQAPQARQHLAFVFWPDANEGQALTNLRNLIYKTRQALPNADQFLQADTQTIQWRPDALFTLDVADFENALRSAPTRATLAQAITCYCGELLPSCYDDWIRPLREDFQQKAITALVQLIALCEAERAYEPAITYTQRLLQLDPLNETTYCTLMRLQAVNGDRAGALHSYQRCVAILQRELDVAPAPSTQELYQRLLTNAVLTNAAKSPSGMSGAQELPLVGRTAEWRAMLNHWYRASSGKSHCLLLTGEAGIGKTCLAEALLAWVTRQGFTVATARCYAVEGALAYAPVVTWLRNERLQRHWSALELAWLTELARLLPELVSVRPEVPIPSPLTESWQRQRLFEALDRALVPVNEQHGTKPHNAWLLFVDDLQWCDRDTLAWLHYVLHTKPQAPLLIVGTVRTEEVLDDHPLLPWLAELRRSGFVTEVQLNRLSAAETTTLAGQLAARELTPVEQTQLYQATEGNPLFVVESIRALAHQAPTALPTLGTQVGNWVWGEVAFNTAAFPLPPTIQAVIGRRLLQLSATARELAGVAATIGRAFTFSVLFKASQSAEEQLVDQLDELCKHRILCEHGEQAYDFTHDCLREVAYSTLSTARRRLLHRRVAQALAATYADAVDQVSGQIAAHYELAGLYEQAIPYYQRAAEVARQVYANADAIRSYRAVIALLSKTAGQESALVVNTYEALGDLFHLITRFDAAGASYADALRTHSALGILDQARLHRKIGNTQRDRGDYPLAQASYLAALTVLGDAKTTDTPKEAATGWWQEWIQIHLELSMLYYWLNQVATSVTLDQQLQPILVQHGTLEQQASYLLNKNRLEMMRNRFQVTPAVVSLVKQALDRLEQAGDQTRLPAAYFALGFNLLWSNDPQGAIGPFHRALHLAEQSGDTSLQTRCLTYLTIAHRQCEHLLETQVFAERSLAAAVAAQMPEYEGMGQANLAWIAWRQGEWSATKEHAQAALHHWDRYAGRMMFRWTGLWPLLAVAHAEQQWADAIAYLTQLLDPSQRAMSPALTTVAEQTVQAWTHHQLDQTSQLLQQVLLLAQHERYL